MKNIIFIICILIINYTAFAQTTDAFRDECTTITMGKKATDDGSVRTSHTDDSHRTRSNVFITPAKDHKQGETVTMYKRVWCDTTKMKSYRSDSIGVIPQIEHTFAYVNSAYPCLNEKQLGIGESTIGGRPSLQSDNGLIDCQRLCTLLLERCTTARHAISTCGDLLKKYGWIDAGECLTIADKNEVWHLEIYGPGKGNKGAVWVAQRVPDEHVAVTANASTIKEIDTNNKKHHSLSPIMHSEKYCKI